MSPCLVAPQLPAAVGEEPAPLLGDERRQGKAVQVDPIKPMLKAPGPERLKLKYNEPLSSFAFKFKLRRYTKVRLAEATRICASVMEVGSGPGARITTYRRR